jgi:DNA-binding LytR/AlgR family response regulator
MIRSIALESSSNARKIDRKFAGFESAMEPIREFDNPVYRQESAGEIKQLFDQNDFILVKNEHKLIKLQIKDIQYIEGKGNYIAIHTTKFKLLTLQTMKKLEAFLLPYQFVRVHKSFIVSFHHLDSIDKHVLYIQDMEIPISDSYRENLKAFLAVNAKQI